jgi:DUF971 family protein
LLTRASSPARPQRAKRAEHGRIPHDIRYLQRVADETTPTKIEQADAGTLRIVWADGRECLYPVRHVRLQCRCANCIDEWSGRPRLDEASVPEDVHPVSISPVGRYALSISWSDGHDTGIYTFETLREICPD